MQVNRLSLLFFCTLIISCTKSDLAPAELIKWIENKENGLIKEETIDGAKYTISLHPSQYMKARAIIEKDSFMLANYKDHNYSVVVKMEPSDNQTQFLILGAIDKSEPFGRINYYLNGIQNDIKVLNGEDTLAVENLVYERLYNVSPAQLILFGFDVKNIAKPIKIIIDDRAIGTGKMQFEFNEKTLQSIPQIKD